MSEILQTFLQAGAATSLSLSFTMHSHYIVNTLIGAGPRRIGYGRERCTSENRTDVSFSHFTRILTPSLCATVVCRRSTSAETYRQWQGLFVGVQNVLTLVYNGANRPSFGYHAL